MNWPIHYMKKRYHSHRVMRKLGWYERYQIRVDNTLRVGYTCNAINDKTGVIRSCLMLARCLQQPIKLRRQASGQVAQSSDRSSMALLRGWSCEDGVSCPLPMMWWRYIPGKLSQGFAPEGNLVCEVEEHIGDLLDDQRLADMIGKCKKWVISSSEAEKVIA